MTSDLRLAARNLARTPGFTAVAAITLALGIGAVSAIFSFVQGILLAPLPYPEPERLVMVWQDHRDRGGPLREWFSWPDFNAYREDAASLDDLAVLTGWAPTLRPAGRGPARRLAGAGVSASMFSTLGVEPALGRSFLESEQTPGEDRVVILGHGLWQRLYDGSPEALGSTLDLGGESYQVVGVMPAGFQLPVLPQSEIWSPLAPDGGLASRGSIWLRAIGRLAPGATLQGARADLATLAAVIAAEHPDTNRGVAAAVYPLRDELVGASRRPLGVLLGAAALVLLIACANLANLLLARATGRRGELAVRAALGAGRARLVRHLLAESLVLAAAGGALGLMLAAYGVDLLKTMLARGMAVPRLDEVALDPRVVAVTCLVALGSGLLFGALPALRASRPDLDRVLRRDAGERSGGGGGRLRGALVVAETALALTLLTGSALLLQSFLRLSSVDPGFEPAGTVTFRLSTPPADYPEAADVTGFYRRLLERLEALPGVESVAATSVLPLGGMDTDIGFRIEGEPPPPPGRSQAVWYRSITPGYFATVGLPLVAGRAPSAAETEAGGSPPVVVNRAFVDRYLQEGDALGRVILAGGLRSEIVGVAGDVKNFGLAAPERPAVYVPHAAVTERSMAVVLRTAAEPASLAGPLRAAVGEIDPALALSEVESLAATLDDSVTPERVTALLAGLFGLVALLLAAVGLYGVMTYSARQRTREIGIRVALGADPRSIERLFLGRGLALAGLGLLLGLAGSLAVSRVLASLLFEVQPTAPAPFVAATAVLAAVAAIASFLPAHRATQVDPVKALHD